MVTCQSSELGWEVTVELLEDSLSLGRGSVIKHVLSLTLSGKHITYTYTHTLIGIYNKHITVTDNRIYHEFI